VREHHDLDPYLVERERLEWELGQAGVVVVADAILDAGTLTVATLDDRDLVIGFGRSGSLGSGIRRGR
jgi:hypothetical protein